MSKTLNYTNATVLGMQNSALWKDQDGILHCQCVLCNKYIGSECDMSYYALIRRKYCDDCARKVRAEKKAEYMRQSRQNKKLLSQRQKRLESENEKLRELNALLDEKITGLEFQIEKLKGR